MRQGMFSDCMVLLIFNACSFDTLQVVWLGSAELGTDLGRDALSPKGLSQRPSFFTHLQKFATTTTGVGETQ